MYYYIEPEVSGELGKNTVIDTTTHPPTVHKLHYDFKDWLGDDLLESFPCFIISGILKNRIVESSLTGFKIENAEMSVSEDFKELNIEKELPPFFWLQVNGILGENDFCLADDGRLVISNNAKKFLENFNIQNADIEPYDEKL